jgi:pyridoxamine 5'-phosphate oxidase
VPDPIGQFGRWFDDAVRGGDREPNAMVLATVDAGGRPRQRTVLLKGFDETGFRFFTNHTSAKGEQIAAEPRVSLLFGWYLQHRQVIVSGRAVKLDPEVSAGYFGSRPRGSQLAAWASPQSRRVADREELESAFARAGERFPDEVPPPPHWGGYRVEPEEIEFWQGRANRLHDRLRFRRDDSDAWVVVRLAP